MKHINVQNGQIIIGDIREHISVRERNLNYLTRPRIEILMTIVQNNTAIVLELDTPSIMALANELSSQLGKIAQADNNDNQ